MTPKELLELVRALERGDVDSVESVFEAAAALRSYAELLSMMEFVDDSLECNPRLAPPLVRETALQLGWESIDTGWPKGSP